MFDRPPHDGNLSDSERQRLDELEQRFAVEDPGLSYSLRTGRVAASRVDPAKAALVGMIATPVILLALFLGGPVPAVAASVLSLLALVITLSRTTRGPSSGPSVYR
ncbi:MAG TPA: DUF3040 domain-containing protein [Pseudonocardia sp.]|jgi:hypothetical protein